MAEAFYKFSLADGVGLGESGGALLKALVERSGLYTKSYFRRLRCAICYDLRMRGYLGVADFIKSSFTKDRLADLAFKKN